MDKTDTQKFKTVAKFSERMPAEILAGMLNDNGIPAGVFGADSSLACTRTSSGTRASARSKSSALTLTSTGKT